MRTWIAIIAVAVISAAFKGCGPAFLGGRELPPRLAAAVTDLPAIVLAALVASAITGPHWADANLAILAGLLTAATAWAFRVPTLLAVMAAITASATVRLIG
jgi:branched-subunit amino acid transport protein